MNYDMLPDLNGFTTNDDQEYKNPFPQCDFRQAALTNRELNFIRNDIDDFTEFRLQLNGDLVTDFEQSNQVYGGVAEYSDI